MNLETQLLTWKQELTWKQLLTWKHQYSLGNFAINLEI